MQSLWAAWTTPVRREEFHSFQIAESKEMVFAALLLNSLQPCEQQWESVCQVMEQNHGFHFVKVKSLSGCFSFFGGS